jgi:hypothetical protein
VEKQCHLTFTAAKTLPGAPSSSAGKDDNGQNRIERTRAFGFVRHHSTTRNLEPETSNCRRTHLPQRTFPTARRALVYHSSFLRAVCRCRFQRALPTPPDRVFPSQDSLIETKVTCAGAGVVQHGEQSTEIAIEPINRMNDYGIELRARRACHQRLLSVSDN